MTTDLLAIAFRLQELEGQLKEAVNRKYDCLKFLANPKINTAQREALTRVFKMNDCNQANIRNDIRELQQGLEK